MELDGSLLLLQGWALTPASLAPPSRLRLAGTDSSGQPWEIDIPLNRERVDVLTALGLPADAVRCGFFFYGRIPGGLPLDLRMESPSGDTILCIWQRSPHVFPRWSKGRLAGWIYLLRRGWRLLRSGQWRDLHRRALKHLRPALASWHRANPVASTPPQPVDWLVIDHDLGGGANQYRRGKTQQELAKGQSLILLTFSVLGLRYVVHRLSSGGSSEILKHLTWPEVLPWIDQIQPRQIFYNNAVSFPDALALVEGLSAYKAEHRDTCRLTLAVHDYFMACPSQHLIHADGQFCDLPAQDVCKDCLGRSQQDMVSLYRHHDLETWRQAWGTLAHAADEVLTFDPSAGRLLGRVFRPLPPGHLVVRPHVVSALNAQDHEIWAQWRQKKQRKRGRIGVVGLIGSDIKGVRRVHELVQTIAHDHLPYEVIAIGQVSPKPSFPACFRETGPYKAEDLTRLVVQNDIDAFFFCSTGPETFSYVLHEIERFGLPVAAFNLGAQATFLSRYPLAITLELTNDAREILEKIKPHLVQCSTLCST